MAILPKAVIDINIADGRSEPEAVKIDIQRIPFRFMIRAIVSVEICGEK